MTIKITSDSTCDLTPELLAQHNISLAHLTVIKGDAEFEDGVTITPADIFNHVAAGGDLCSTSAYSIGQYQAFFETFANDFDAVIHVNLGSGFSSCHQNACVAAQDYDNVYIVDSMNLCTGQGLVVLEVCKMAESGMSPEEIMSAIATFVPRVEASFVLNQLNYMVKGGRCSSAAALGANLLNLKPCIEVKDGKMAVVKKYRGSFAKCLANYIKDRLTNRDDLDTSCPLFYSFTTVEDGAMEAAWNAVQEYSTFPTIHRAPAGCTISCHCGPDTLGILFVRK